MTDLIKSFNGVIFKTQFHQMTIISSKFSQITQPYQFPQVQIFLKLFWLYAIILRYAQFLLACISPIAVWGKGVRTTPLRFSVK